MMIKGVTSVKVIKEVKSKHNVTKMVSCKEAMEDIKEERLS